jgi:hypothetical protein
MNEKINLIIETLKELNGDAPFEHIFNIVGMNFSSENELLEIISKMINNEIIIKSENSGNIMLRAGLSANEDRFVDVRLTIDEAVILFNFLNRVNDNEINRLIQDQSEQYLFWKIEGILERKLVEPYQPDFKQIVIDAQKRMINLI